MCFSKPQARQARAPMSEELLVPLVWVKDVKTLEEVEKRENGVGFLCICLKIVCTCTE